MSKTVDQRVVEMQFDNKQFERNVSSTMSMLDKLEQSLNFSGASKGLESINASAKNVDMTGLANGVETVRARFSALEVMGVTALANITNSAVNAGKRMASALTIDPIKTGFQEYETQINAVQTILANTQSKGSTLDDVNKALEELNKYADLTIYNFTEMTRNIGTFTAAGIDLDTSVNAIQGIANLAAVSGSTSQQASTAMYQLSQALASGTVKLMDWNSVVNAGMGGEMFQNALKETSQLLGTGAEAAIKAEGSFRESLRTGWLTAEVLTETLKKFTTTGANERVAEYTGLSKEAVAAALESAEAQYGEAEAIEYASKALAEKSGKSADEIKSVLQFAKTAEDAATKVKTFTQLWDVMKEAAQSGWAQTWKIIVGDFEAAKDLLTPLADFFTKIIGKMSDARNNLLKGAMGNPFSDLIEKVTGMTKSVGKAVDTVKDYEEIVNRIIKGEFGNGEERYKKLTELGYDYAHAQNLVNEKLGSSVRHATTYTDAQGKVADAQSYTVDQLAEMSDAQLENLGYTKEQIAALRALAEHAKKAGKPLSEFIEEMSELDGRTLLINSFKNVGQSLVKVFVAMAEAWREIFPPMTSLQLYNIIASLHRFSEYLKMSDTTAENLKRTLKGVFAAFDIVLTVVGGPIKWAFSALLKLLGMADIDILKFTGNIGDLIVKLRDWIDEHNIFLKGIELIAPIVRDAADAVMKWYKSLKDSTNLPEDIAEGIINGFKAIPKLLWKIIEAVRDEVLDGFGKLPEDMIAGFVNGMGEGVKIAAETMLLLGKKILEAIKGVLGIHSPSTEFHEVGKNSIEGLLNGLKEGASTVWEFIKGVGTKCLNIVKNMDWGKVMAFGMGIAMIGIAKKFADAFDALTAPLDGLADMLSGLGSKFKGQGFEAVSKGIYNIAKSLLLLVGAIAILTLLDTGKMWGAIGALAALAGILTLLAFALSKMGSIKDVGKSAVSIMSISASLLILSFAMKSMAGIKVDDLPGILGAMAVAIVSLAAIMIVFGKFVNPVNAAMIDKAGIMMLKMSAALLLVVTVIKRIAGLSNGEIKRGLVVIAGIELLFAGIILVSKIAGDNAGKAGGMLLAMSVSMLLMIGLVKLASGMDVGEVKRGLAVVAGIELLFVALVAVSKFAGRNAAKAGVMLIGMSLALMMTASVIKQVAGISDDDIKRGLLVIGSLELMFAALIAVSNLAGQNAVKAGVMLLLMSGALMVLTGVIFILSKIEPDGLWRAVGAISVLETLFIGLIGITSIAQDMKGTLIVMVVAVGLLTAAVAGLSFIDPESLKTATAALSAVMVAFSIMVGMTKFAQTGGPLIGVMSSMLAVVVGLSLVLKELAKIEDPSRLMTVTASLSVLMLSFAGSLAIIGMVGHLSTAAIGPMYAMVGVVALLAVILGGMAYLNVEPSIQTASALSLLLTTMSGALLLLNGVAPTAMAGVGALAVLGLVVGELAVILGLMAHFEVTPSIETAASLSILLLSMSGALLILGGVGAMGPAAFVGIGALATLIAGVGGLITAIGYLVTEFPKLEEFLNTGIPVLEKIGYALGSFFGNVVGGFLGNMTSGMPQIGTDLSAFMNNAKDFINGAKNIDPAALSGVSALAKAIMVITGAELVDRLASAFGGGESSIATFGAKLPQLGTDFAAFVSNLGTFDESQVTSVTCAGQAIKALADAASTIPNEGGLWAKIVGDNSLATFGEKLPGLGTQLNQFITNLGTFTSAQVTTVYSAVNAIKAISTIGEVEFNATKISSFSTNITTLGDKLGKFCSKMSEIGTSSLDSAASKLRTILAVIRDVSASDGTTAKNFGEALKKLAEGGVDKFVTAFTGTESKASVENAAGKTIQYFTNKVKDMKPDVNKAFKALVSEAVDGLEDKYSDFYDAGEYLVKGFAKGISDNDYRAEAKAAAMATKAKEAAEDALGIQSPSKVFYGIGKFTVDGFVNALVHYGKKAYGASEQMAEHARVGLSDTLSRIADVVSLNVDAEPTIRPVLDLSGVESGASAIASLLDTNPSVGVMAKVGAISSGMNRSQNGSNDDVVYAINKLRSELGKVGNSYSVGNVSYQEGSDVADAIKTLARAAKMERRS